MRSIEGVVEQPYNGIFTMIIITLCKTFTMNSIQGVMEQLYNRILTMIIITLCKTFTKTLYYSSVNANYFVTRV